MLPQTTQPTGWIPMSQDHHATAAYRLSPASSSSIAPSNAGAFRLSATVIDTSLAGYLHGLLNTILFMRLLGIIEPADDMPTSDQAFEGVIYPTINDSTTTANTDDLINRSPRDWVSSKIKSLIRTYTDKKTNRKRVKNLSDVFTKTVFVLKLYNTTTNKDWETWIMDLNVLDTLSSTTYFTNPVEKLQEKTTDGKPPAKDFSELYDFISQDAQSRTETMKSSFTSNMFHIIRYSEQNTDNIPNIKTQYLNPFLIKTDFLIDWKFYNTNADFSFDLDLNISSLNNSANLSQESMEYINTTENGDVIVSSGSNSENDIAGRNKGIKTDLWENGYNFFKKMLE